MSRFLALLYKDFLLLLRDKAGLLFMFLMPMALVLVMTGMQEGAFSSHADKHIALLIADQDKDTVGVTITRKLQNESLFEVTLANDAEKGMTEERLKGLVTQGKYLIGIYIPDSTTKRIRDNAANTISDALPRPTDDTDSVDTITEAQIRIYIDPTTERSFRQILSGHIRLATLQVEHDITLDEISDALCEATQQEEGSIDLSNTQNIDLQEIIAGDNTDNSMFNAAVHNVPAWTLFAIFFIVISFSGNLIKERQDGSFARLMTTPCSYFTYLSSKLTVYLTVCLLQFFLIVAMGIWLFPVVGLPEFSMAGHLGYCLIVVVCAALAAIGFGMIISTFATTHQQAATFGAVSVVILSAIGGIWVPTFLMPKFLNSLSKISPLNWGIDAFYDILLRWKGPHAFMPECALLLAFAAICFTIAVLSKKKELK